MFQPHTKTYLNHIASIKASANRQTFTKLLELLGNPHLDLNYIHIAGTNGKGSTANFICSILTQAGYRTGLYTSPDLNHVTERIRIGEDLITEATFECLLSTVKTAHDTLLKEGYHHLTYFELLTALAFLYYQHTACDIVVLETGMGGTYDATNVIPSALCTLITPISLDHTARLGTTL